MPQGLNRQEELTAAVLGLNGVALTASNNSNAFRADGYNQLTLEIRVTWGAATAVTFYLQTSPDGTNWGFVQTGSIASGVETLSNRQFSKAVSASVNYTVNIPLNYTFVRIYALTGSGSPTTDTIVVNARLGNV